MDSEVASTADFSDISSRRNLDLQHSRLNNAKTSDSAKRYAFLLGQTDLFKHFIDLRASEDAEFKKTFDEAVKSQAKSAASGAGGRKGGATGRHRKTEKEEDSELLGAERDTDRATVFTESPSYINGTMRDYQVEGLNWLISLYENGINGILADEMGLGKTLQTISFLGYLRTVRSIPGPHLVIVPKSTMHNWRKEFEHWIPEVKVLLLQGEKQERARLIQEDFLEGEWDVTITSYEMVIREKTHLKKFAWEYIIIDEAHRIKNEESLLSQVIRLFNSRNRLLITGTPLQNNMHELWALLNFLLPDVFSSSEAFDNWFEQQEGQEDVVIKQLHRILRPFLLRRIKMDVEKSLLPKKETNLYIGMSQMQKTWYRRLLEKDIDAVNGAGGKREGKTRLLNIVMQLRKCCNHPYLFDGAEPGPPYETNDNLINDSGKLVVLDKLLTRMKEKGSRVLIFSQMSRVLDILEDYCWYRSYTYCRIDGQTSHEDRINAIEEYQKPDSDKFLFLLTTRAGGLGITLTAADVVVLFDSDWNPQADLQAMDRAHRIGQKKQVYVYRFVTDHSVEEKILERAAQKLRLDQLVIQQGRARVEQKETKDDLLNMVQHGAATILDRTKDVKEGEAGGDADDLDAILAAGEERTQTLNKKFEGFGVDDLQKFEASYAFDGGKELAKRKENQFWINPAKRERKADSYNMDAYWRGALTSAAPKKEAAPKAPRPPKQVHIQDHQFYPPQLAELQEREARAFQKEQGYKVQVDETTTEEEAAIEQQLIDDAVPLTEQEKEDKEAYIAAGFGTWQRRDFHSFLRGCERHGRNDIAAIVAEIGTKTEQEVKAYSRAFFKERRMQDEDMHDKYLAQVEAGEERIRRHEKQAAALRKKVQLYKAPLTQLKLHYSTNKGKVYSDEEDRFLVVKLHELGMHREDIYDAIRAEIRESPMFRFDWFIKSRTTAEIQRRCATLLNMIVKEFSPEDAVEGPNSKKRAAVDDDAASEASAVQAPKAKKVKAESSATSSRAGTPKANGKSSTTGAATSAAKGSAKAKGTPLKNSTPSKSSKKSGSRISDVAVKPAPAKPATLPPTASGRVRKQATR
ncbi:chromatin remodeling complex Adenosinetriphosphatase [Savitreella phatthalungensis]